MAFKRILVPLDLSDTSMIAVDHAAQMARESKGEVILVFVVEPLYVGGSPTEYAGVPDLALLMGQQRQEARKRLGQVSATLKKKGIRNRVILADGIAYERILAAAKAGKADVIVMSTHGRTGLSHLFLGSVAEKVVRLATCPVLTVRGRAGTRKKAARTKRAA